MKKRTKLVTMLLALTSFATLSFSSCDMMDELINKMPGVGVESPNTPDIPDTPESPDTPDNPDAPDTPDVPATPVLQFDNDEISMFIDSSNPVSPKIMVGDEEQTDVQFTYSFEDETIAKYENGNVVGLKIGETEMTVSFNIFHLCHVRVF